MVYITVITSVCCAYMASCSPQVCHTRMRSRAQLVHTRNRHLKVGLITVQV